MSRGSFILGARILVNGLRLYFRAWQGKRHSLLLTLLIQGALIGFLHLQVPIIFAQVAQAGGARGGAGLACVFVLLFTLMAGFHRSIEVLYNRGDLPYLLSSPVSARLIVVTRLVDVLVTTLLATLFVVMPMLNGAVYLFGRHWLWGWAAWLLGTGAVGTLALLGTVLAVKSIGARGARTLMQVLGVLVGTFAILAMQAPTWLRQVHIHPERAETLRRYFALFEAPPWPQLASAAAGDWRGLAALAAGAGLTMWLALRVLEREFVTGVQGAAEDSGGPSLAAAARPALLARAWSGAFRVGRWSVLVRKELRTLRRDPLLIARSSTQLISLLPAVIGLFFLPRVPAIAVLSIIAATLTALTIAGLMTAGDESLDVLCTSPTSRARAMWARTLAAALPGVAIAWIAGGVLVLLGAPGLGVGAGVIATFLGLAHAWLGGCTTPRQTTEDRAANRPIRATWQVFASMLVSGLGAAAVGAAGMGAPVALAFLFGALALVGGGMMFLASPRPIWEA